MENEGSPHMNRQTGVDIRPEGGQLRQTEQQNAAELEQARILAEAVKQRGETPYPVQGLEERVNRASEPTPVEQPQQEAPVQLKGLRNRL